MSMTALSSTPVPSATVTGSEALPGLPDGSSFGVRSEAGLLRTAVLDVRDGTTDEALAEALALRGVRVLPLLDLLGDVLADRSVRRVMAGRLVALEASSPATARRITAALIGAPSSLAAARMVLRGIPSSDKDRGGRSPDRANYLVPPLPDSRSLRLPVVAVGPRPLTALVSGREGRRSVAIMSAIGRRHPLFASVAPRRYRAHPGLRLQDATIDGDDVQVAPDGSVIVGVGRRTSLHGARQLALSVLETGDARRVVVVMLPEGPLDRLDRLLAILGGRTALLHPAAMGEDVAAWEIRGAARPDGTELVAREPRPFRAILPALFASGAHLHVVPDEPGVHGPQHFLALEPGDVLTSASATDPATVLLERAGLDVTTAPEDHGHAYRAGGIRRLVLPVQRDALPLGPTAL